MDWGRLTAEDRPGWHGRRRSRPGPRVAQPLHRPMTSRLNRLISSIPGKSNHLSGKGAVAAENWDKDKAIFDAILASFDRG